MQWPKFQWKSQWAKKNQNEHKKKVWLWLHIRLRPVWNKHLTHWVIHTTRMSDIQESLMLEMLEHLTPIWCGSILFGSRLLTGAILAICWKRRTVTSQFAFVATQRDQFSYQEITLKWKPIFILNFARLIFKFSVQFVGQHNFSVTSWSAQSCFDCWHFIFLGVPSCITLSFAILCPTLSSNRLPNPPLEVSPGIWQNLAGNL